MGTKEEYGGRCRMAGTYGGIHGENGGRRGFTWRYKEIRGDPEGRRGRRGKTGGPRGNTRGYGELQGNTGEDREDDGGIRLNKMEYARKPGITWDYKGGLHGEYVGGQGNTVQAARIKNVYS